MACSKFGIWAYHLKELLLSFQKIIKLLNLDHQNSSYTELTLVLSKWRGPTFNSHLWMTITLVPLVHFLIFWKLRRGLSDYVLWGDLHTTHTVIRVPWVWPSTSLRSYRTRHNLTNLPCPLSTEWSCSPSPVRVSLCSLRVQMVDR